MSIEACVVNYCKHTFPEEMYPAIKKDRVENLEIPKEWYDPSLRSQDLQDNAEADEPAGTGWGFNKGKNPFFANFSNGWDDKYAGDEVENEDDDVVEDEDEDEGEDEDEDKDEDEDDPEPFDLRCDRDSD